jgi:hypothetical protein
MAEVMDMVMDVFMIVLMLSIIVKAVPVLNQASAFYTAHSYQGALAESLTSINEYPYSLDIINTPPYLPWVSADIMNGGPSRIYISVNTADSWKIVEVGEAYTLDMLGATQRIEKIYYKTDASKVSSARITGRY